MIIGLTGQTGAGKTSISSILCKQKGIKVIDCDKLSRTVVMDGSECLVKLALEFSPFIINKDGNLNRQKLAEIVFNDKQKLNKLNEIIFPYITNEVNSLIKKYEEMEVQTIVVDAPTLFESGLDKICDVIVVVMADEQIRLARILERDNITPEMAASRMNSQLTEQFFMEHADYIIDNSGDKIKLAKSIMTLLEKIKNKFE